MVVKSSANERAACWNKKRRGPSRRLAQRRLAAHNSRLELAGAAAAISLDWLQWRRAHALRPATHEPHFLRQADTQSFNQH